MSGKGYRSVEITVINNSYRTLRVANHAFSERALHG
jgi:hypothetical protein